MTNRPPSGARGDRSLRRRPPCRNFGGDARSQEIAARIVERSAQISSLHWEQLADIAEFDRSEAWRGDGSVSMVTWVTGRCGVSTSTARQWVRSAANLETLPCLAEGLASGQLSLDLVEPLAEVASADTDAALRQASAHWSVRQARELVAWHRAQREATAEEERADGAEVPGDAERGTERSGPEGDPRAGSAVREFERRTLRFNDTRRTVWIAFTTDDYATAKSALVTRVAADKRGMMSATLDSSDERDSSDEPDSYELDPLGYVPYDQRLYDTMMRLFRARGAPLSGSRPPVRPRVVVHAPLELLLGCSASASL